MNLSLPGYKGPCFRLKGKVYVLSVTKRQTIGLIKNEDKGNVYIPKA
jgi:hypothetical protein